MVAFPEVQRKAQEEIDEVVGRSRMPTFADRDHLPYIRAIVKEVLRWRPAAPLGDYLSGFWETLDSRSHFSIRLASFVDRGTYNFSFCPKSVQ